MTICSISLKPRSDMSDYACPDGEIAGAVNLSLVDGGLIPNYNSNPGNNGSGTSPGNNGGGSGPGAAGGAGTGDDPFVEGVMQKPPMPEVEFSLLKSVVEGWHIHADMLPSKIVDAPSGGKDFMPGESDWGEKAMLAIAAFENDCSRGNLFTQPFFAMAAYRLSDGSHICPSPPMLMIPNSGPLMVEGSQDFSVPTMKMSVVAAACRLQWRVKMPPLPEEWQGRITHLDVFISQPVLLYNPKGRGKGYHRVKSDNFTHCLDSSGEAGEHTVYDGEIVQGWKAEETDAAVVAHGVMQTSTFYLVGETPLRNMATSSEFEDVILNRGGLSVLESMETYEPDFAHLSEITAGGQSFFSGRVTAWNLTLTPPAPLPLRLTAPYSTNPDLPPRWVFVPDPHAGGYPFPAGGEGCAISLRRHPAMRGAFHWGGFGKSALCTLLHGEAAQLSSAGQCVALPGGVWRSGKGNMWLFPDRLLMELHVGEVIAVCRAFRASGLVATTSPTAYCFTTEGVFLLKEMDDGSLRDAGLICACRLRDASAVELLPKGVRFHAADGSIVEIEGTKVVFPDAEPPGAGDDAGDGWGTFVTRPLKLGDAEVRKQLRGVAMRGVFDPGEMELSVYGSDDLTVWHKIAAASRSCVSGLWGARFRFFRVAVKARLKEGESMQAIVIKKE